MMNVVSESIVSFFFSSRRRHTRWTGDWSSDVCSSDLQRYAGDYGGGNWRTSASNRGDFRDLVTGWARDGVNGRSEERRVGKECSPRLRKKTENDKQTSMICI